MRKYLPNFQLDLQFPLEEGKLDFERDFDLVANQSR